MATTAVDNGPGQNPHQKTCSILSRLTIKTQTGKLTSWSDTLIDTDSFISASTGNQERELIVFVSQVMTNPTPFDLSDCGPNEAQTRPPEVKGTGRQLLCCPLRRGKGVGGVGGGGTRKGSDNTKASSLQCGTRICGSA